MLGLAFWGAEPKLMRLNSMPKLLDAGGVEPESTGECVSSGGGGESGSGAALLRGEVELRFWTQFMSDEGALVPKSAPMLGAEQGSRVVEEALRVAAW